MRARAPIVMPKLGLTMTEGVLSSWRVAPGHKVKPGDILFVVETEKVANEIVAEAEGEIEALLLAEGETALVGATVATWVTSATTDAPLERAADVAERAPAPSPPIAPAARANDAPARLVATPFARKLAKTHGVDLRDVVGGGPNGRIKAAGILAAIPSSAPVSPAPEPRTPAIELAAGESQRPASATERSIARRLTESKRTIPHFYVLAEADVTGLLAFRAKANAAGTSPRLTLTHFVIAAVARALVETPAANGVWRDGRIVTLGGVDVGVAIDTEFGLLAPVLANVDRQGLNAIASALSELARKARERRVTEDDLRGGAITVSNVGMFGSSHLVPIINPGQSAILGVAAVRPAFRPDAEGAPKLCQELGLALSCDHRLWDGMKAARFLNLIVQFLEQPLNLLR